MAELGARTRAYFESLTAPAKGWHRFVLLAFLISVPINIAFSGWPLWFEVFLVISAALVTPSLILGFRNARRPRP